MPKYVVFFQHVAGREAFRLPELASLIKFYGIKATYDTSEENVERYTHKHTLPLMDIELESDADALTLMKRSIMIKGIFVPLAEGTNWDTLHEDAVAKVKSGEIAPVPPTTTVRFEIQQFGRKTSSKEKREYVDRFMDLHFLDGTDVKMINPDHIYWLVTMYPHNQPSKDICNAYLFREVGLGDMRAPLLAKYSLKTRHYIGTTSMDVELSLLAANQSLCKRGSFVLDPFNGTGSMILTCAEFGAIVFGSDIDPRVIRDGKEGRTVFSNFEHYGCPSQLAGLMIHDQTLSAWRPQPLFDAIVTDPPYGVRAGAKRVGARKGREIKPVEPRFQKQHIPACRAYTLVEVLNDLLVFAAQHLVLGGRLVTWVPTHGEYQPEDIPGHVCLKQIANSNQPLSAGANRRLVTFEKILDFDPELHDRVIVHNAEVPAHANFAQKYFKGEKGRADNRHD